MVNPSGIDPTWIRVLVRLDEVEEVTAGGIVLPQIVKEREELKQVKATMIAVGGNAFDDFKGAVPQPGDRVYVGRYAGARVIGEDGIEYRMVNGRDVFGIIKDRKE